MIRLHSRLFKFSNDFYHPCHFKLNIDAVDKQTCSLAVYVNYFRRYGHHFAKLDPLDVYNK
jgi:2-oxoglutarate dehydrogenase complex dehydrogenase (E1) component-like enzyme